VTMSTTVPNLREISSKTLHELASFKPTHVHYQKCLYVVGFEMSDGEKRVGGDEDEAAKSAELPEGITQISVFFRKDEMGLHSIVFSGNTSLHIGLSQKHDDVAQRYGEKRGREEIYIIEHGYELLGCEMFHSDYYTYGVRWLTW
jgi:hypothetical protein